MKKIYKDVLNKLAKYPERLLHVITVARISESLAIIHKVDSNKAFLAGLMHDYAKYNENLFYEKYISSEDLLKYSNEQHLYHAISAANYFKMNYKIQDDLYDAIKNHVYGKIAMNPILKILFISDSIYLNGKNNSRYLYKLATRDLDLAVVETIKSNERYLAKKNMQLAKKQIDTLNYYEELLNGKIKTNT